MKLLTLNKIKKFFEKNSAYPINAKSDAKQDTKVKKVTLVVCKNRLESYGKATFLINSIPREYVNCFNGNARSLIFKDGSVIEFITEDFPDYQLRGRPIDRVMFAFSVSDENEKRLTDTLKLCVKSSETRSDMSIRRYEF